MIPNLSSSDKNQVLRERARRLARDTTAELIETGPVLEVIEFALAHERYALEASYVREVQPLHDLTPLPGAPEFVRGLVNLRGEILAVIDMKRFFDLPERGIGDLHSVLFVEGAGMSFGLLADQVLGTRRLPLASLQPALPTLTEVRADYLRGVTAERLVVLDGARLLSDPRLVVRDDAGD